MVDDFPFQSVPVIEAGSPQRPLVDLKSQRSDQPQFRVQRDACPADGTGIGRNFRLIKDDVQVWLVFAWGSRHRSFCVTLDSRRQYRRQR